ncbi:MAG TPA: Gfo/Idh/MocA family oxidoreductase [Gemmatimonadales bacterium]|nr:Gfo/Idh/MocA family oxidoreductase [Gemmatimonadales bacterium]
MSGPVPVGVIGVGALGRHHARHLAQHPGARLVGVYDASPARAAEIAAQVGTEAWSDVDALLGKVRGVSIAAPTSFHHELGMRALDRGVGVLMEKPITVTVAEADDLIARAIRAGVPLHVGQIERFNRAVRAIAPVVRRPRFIECERLAPFSLRGADVSVVLDLMVHDLDLALHLTGGAEAVDVRADGGALLSPTIDLARARIEFAGGAVASITASRLARGRVRRTRIYQADGYLSLDLATGAAEFTRLRAGWTPGQSAQSVDDVVERIPLTAPEADALGLEVGHFVDALGGRASGGVSGQEGRAALALARRVEDAVARAPIVPSAH